MRKRPRRWVNPSEVSAMLGDRESATLFAGELPKPQSSAPSTDGAALLLLVEALRSLNLEVAEAASSICEAIATAGRREVEPQTFGDA